MAEHIIPVCSYCQKEYPTVDAAIKASMKQHGMNGQLKFSHGYCTRHYVEMMKQYKSDEEIKASLANIKNQVPDLAERSDLVNLWSKGIFTPEQLQAVQQNQQQVNEGLINRLRTLAGIKGQ